MIRVGGIGFRYAAYLAALTLAVVAVALSAAGLMAFRQLHVIQEEIHGAISSARAADEEDALRGSVNYLAGRLFNPAHQLDVERLGEEITLAGEWLPLVSFVVTGADRRVLSDDGRQGARYGELIEGPLPSLASPAPLILARGKQTEVRFLVRSGDVVAGWGVLVLGEARWRSSLRGLEERTAALWAAHRASLLSLGLVTFVVTLALGLMTSALLSRSLARPLTEMSRAAAQIASGNLEERVEAGFPGELGELARALNRMAMDLAAHEAALRAERADLARKNAELERFSYTVSHDLKSPLVTIRGFASLAQTDVAAGASERVLDDLARIGSAADKMHALLDDLLELSRVGRVVHPPEDVPLGDLAREAVELVRGRLAEKGVAVEIAPDLPVVRADRRRLLEVLQNLIENAAKFTGSQTVPRVEVGVREGAEGRVFYVRDNGRGIEARHLERVFDLFAKLEASAEGTGVGLALARRVVEAHGGRLWAESEGLGRGTSFCFTLAGA